MSDYRAEVFVCATEHLEAAAQIAEDHIVTADPMQVWLMNMMKAQVLATLATAPVDVILGVREVAAERAKEQGQTPRFDLLDGEG